MTEIIIKLCPVCGSWFETKPSKKRRFCSQKCSSRDPERRKTFSENMRKTNLRRRDLLSRRMAESNPSNDPTILEKMLETKRKKGTLNTFAGTRGGNGKLTEPQRILSEDLGWPTEVAVSLGPRKKGWPTHYKIDIANERLKLGIEVDGKGHRTKARMATDKKKESKLIELGWEIIRIPNEEILTDLEAVHHKIAKVVLQRKNEAKTTSI